MLVSQTPLAPYVPGADGSKTALVSTYQNGSDGSYSYYIRTWTVAAAVALVVVTDGLAAPVLIPALA